MKGSTVIIPGPEIVLWWGVQVPVLACVFGIVEILIGHVIAPAAVPATALPWQKQLGVVLGGIMISIGISIATGQRPLLVLAWSIGIGFSGITIFANLGKQTRDASKTLTAIVIERIAGAVADKKEDGK